MFTQVEKQGTIFSLKEALSELCGIKPRNMQVAELWNNKIYKLFHDEVSISSIRENDSIWVYEQEEVLVGFRCVCSEL